MGVRFDSVALPEAVEQAMALLEGGGGCIVTPNAEIVYGCRETEGLRDVLNAAALTLPDGIGVVYASKILKRPLRGRVAGIDFAAGLMERMAGAGKKLFLLGARPGVAEQAAEKLRAKYPGLCICGTHDGYFREDGPVIEKINASGADAVFVCLGAPKQELWMAAHRDELAGKLLIGLGGSLDVFAGAVKRAPEAWRRLGLEWLYRFIREPSRFGRMLRLPLFLLWVIAERIKGEDYMAEKPRKGTRPRKRRGKRSGALGAPLYVIFVLSVSLVLAFLSWRAACDVFALDKEYATAVVTVEKEDTMGEIASTLKEEGLIRHRWLFRFYAAISAAREEITAGVYEHNTDMDYHAIVTSMGASSSTRQTTMVTIPEGYTMEQIFRLLDSRGVCTYDDLMETAAEHDYNFSFLKDLPLGDAKRLEGYLFPDTYEFYMGERALYAINRMLVNFDAKVTDAMRGSAAEIAGSVRNMVIIASMIEKETDGEDQKNIASVIYNRLNNPSAETAGFLQIDATLYYVTGRLVTQDDYQTVDSPYNTYLYKGLPAGPISNPGMASIYAALNPASTKYYYYALDKEGTHHFFKTYAEHSAFVASLNG